tara:strand:+ start:53 stop:520 length:468 start_codon:yes stop_codon:yes gene_type:complete
MEWKDDCPIQVKNVKIHMDMSEETLCFSASVYMNGKRVGTASNRGHGGCNDYSDRLDRREDINEWLEEANLVWADGDEVTFEKLDFVIGELVEDFDRQSQIKRWMRTQVLFRLRGDAEGGYRTYKLGNNTRERIHKHCMDTYGDRVIWLDGEVVQ